MKKFNSKLILQHILSKAPHTKIYQLSHIFHGIPAHLHQNMSSKDNTYLQIFQYDVFCQYMNHEQYRIVKHVPSFLMNNLHHLKQYRIAQKQQNKSITVQSRLLDVITKLMSNKDRFDIFQQVQQVIISMPTQQMLKNNKQIIHLYKWLKTQKQWQNQQIKLLSQQLKIIIINKIKQTNIKLQQILIKYKLSKAMKQDIKNQLQQQSKQLKLDMDMDMERNNSKEEQKINEVVCMNKDKSQEIENVQIQRSR